MDSLVLFLCASLFLVRNYLNRANNSSRFAICKQTIWYLFGHFSLLERDSIHIFRQVLAYLHREQQREIVALQQRQDREQAERQREQAERQREQAERQRQLVALQRRHDRERAEQQRELQQLRGRVSRVLSLEAQQKACECVFTLHMKRRGSPVGAAVFYGNGAAATADHNLPAGTKVGSVVFGMLHSGSWSGRPFSLAVSTRNDTLDLATLRCCSGSHPKAYLESIGVGSLDSLQGQTFALCAFQTAIHEELEEEFGSDLTMGVMQATGIKISHHGRHMVFSSLSFSGDSGAALLLYDGQLVGIHTGIVNELKERMRTSTDFGERLSEAENSLAELVRGVAQGCVAVLATQFPTS